MPLCGDGGHATAGGGRELIEFGPGGIFGVSQRIEVDKDGADYALPFLACGDFGIVACAIVAGGPVVENDALVGGRAGRGHVIDEIEFVGAAADVLVGWVDEIDADVVLGAGPAPGLEFVHKCVVAVLVLDGVGVDAAGIDALLFGVDGVVLGLLAHQHVAIFVDGQPVEVGIDILEDEAVFADVDEGVRSFVVVLVVRVEPAGSTLHGDAGFDVHAATSTAGAP